MDENQQVLMVVDGRTGQMLEHPDSLFGKWGIREPLKDFLWIREKLLAAY